MSSNELEIIKEKKKEFDKDIEYLNSIKNETLKNIDDWQEELKIKFDKNEDNIAKGRKYDKSYPPDMLVEEVDNTEHRAKNKPIGRMMNGLVVGGVALIGALMILAGVCESGNVCNGDSNIPLIILQSELMLVLVAMVIAPAVARILKEKYDIQIEEGQISMIYKDAINAVKMYSSEASTLRDENGRLSSIDQIILKNLAFSSLKANFDKEKYIKLAVSVGAPVIEKAIERAAKDEKFERLPFDKTQILEITRQAMDAFPMIVKWKDKDPELKRKFVAGHVKRLLATMGVEGYAYKILESVLDSEANKRIAAAAIADKNKLLEGMDLEDPYIKYTSTILSVVTKSLKKTSSQE